MSNSRKIAITRTAMLFALVVISGLFSVAVYEDRSEGTLMDEQGIIDKETSSSNSRRGIASPAT